MGGICPAPPSEESVPGGRCSLRTGPRESGPGGPTPTAHHPARVGAGRAEFAPHRPAGVGTKRTDAYRAPPARVGPSGRSSLRAGLRGPGGRPTGPQPQTLGRGRGGMCARSTEHAVAMLSARRGEKWTASTHIPPRPRTQRRSEGADTRPKRPAPLPRTLTHRKLPSCPSRSPSPSPSSAPPSSPPSNGPAPTPPPPPPVSPSPPPPTPTTSPPTRPSAASAPETRFRSPTRTSSRSLWPCA